MGSKFRIGTIILISTVVFTYAAAESLQAQCLNEAEANKVIDSFASTPSETENKAVRKELLAMRDEQLNLNSRIGSDVDRKRDLIPESNRVGEAHLLRVCQIIKDSGWPTKDEVREDGVQALSLLIMNNKAYKAQRELLPVLVAAANKGYVAKSLLAVLVDGIRVGQGAPQLFGTQATVRSDAIYLYPLANESKVDDWRKEYGLPLLADEIRSFENRYGLPLLKLHRPPGAAVKNDKSSDASALGISGSGSEDEVVTVNTQLVSLNVRVDSRATDAPSVATLSQKDFSIFENGVEQPIEFFAAAEKPFDLVLVLDFSGSTLEKRNLIKKAAMRFVASTRLQDRVAVVAFGDEIKLVSDLIDDKAALAQKIKDIDLSGLSPIWDSLNFAFQNVIDKQSSGRRNAIIIMSDGLDNSPKTVFADLVENVRGRDTSIFSVCLSPERQAKGWERKGEHSLQILSDDSGGTLYNVRNIRDLDGIYDQVIKDLGTVYTMGYTPVNEVRDGSWREISVKIKDKPDLVAKTRRGYYAK